MTFDPEFKKALQQLPDAEKDKLILRLLKLNMDLANKLYFELVDTETAEDKREKLHQIIIKRIEIETKEYYSPGYLLMGARDLSGAITNHVTVTKDKWGEISLNCLMLLELLKHNNERIDAATTSKSYTLCIYIVNRIFKILMLMQKKHEDLHIDFQRDIESIGNLVKSNKNLMKMAVANGLEVNWLIEFNIPKNIAGIYKSLREKGLLR